MSLILGIDPGSRKTGFGIINYVSGRSEYVTSGVIKLPGGELPERLRIIFCSVTELVELHCPQELAIEQVFMAKSAGSALKLGQARGAASIPNSTRVRNGRRRGRSEGHSHRRDRDCSAFRSCIVRTLRRSDRTPIVLTGDGCGKRPAWPGES